MDEIFELTADEITVEITDKKTGQVFKRELPVEYYLRLRGENLDGSLSELIFYTPRGIQRVKDLTGKGADHDNCGGHGH